MKLNAWKWVSGNWFGSEARTNDEQNLERSLNEENSKLITSIFEDLAKGNLAGLKTKYDLQHQGKIAQLKTKLNASLDLASLVPTLNFPDQKAPFATKKTFMEILSIYAHIAILEWAIHDIIEPALAKNSDDWKEGINQESLKQTLYAKLFFKSSHDSPSASQHKNTFELDQTALMKKINSYTQPSSNTSTIIHALHPNVPTSSPEPLKEEPIPQPPTLETSKAQSPKEQNKLIMEFPKAKPNDTIAMTSTSADRGRTGQSREGKREERIYVQHQKEFELSTKHKYVVEATIDNTVPAHAKVLDYKYTLSKTALNDPNQRLDNIAEVLLRGLASGAFVKGITLRGTEQSVQDAIKILSRLKSSERPPVDVHISGKESFTMNFDDEESWRKINLPYSEALLDRNDPIKLKINAFKLMKKDWPEANKDQFAKSFMEDYNRTMSPPMMSSP